MKSKLYIVLPLIMLTLLIFSCQESVNPVDPTNQSTQNNTLQKGAKNGDVIPGQYIVVFNNDVTRVPEVANEKAKLHAATIGHIYSHSIKGFSAKMSAKAAEKLANDPNVKSVTPDRVITLAPPIKISKRPVPPDPEPTVQETPWGITRVGGAAYIGRNVAWIIDTGIDLDHLDLNVDASRSVTFVDRTTTADDDHGHGTHVAGTIAAKDNEIDVVGVAAGATVVAVKVLNRRGSGYTSGVIAGIDYVAEKGSVGDVANMSLGGGAYQPLDDAVIAAASNGIFFSLAAGNESGDANNHSPARVNGPNIYTVSAMDNNDDWAYFSNYGNPPIDYCAPGYRILSLYKNGGMATMSGTSMAAPHVAGILLLGNVNIDGTVNGDPDGNPDPIAVHIAVP